MRFSIFIILFFVVTISFSQKNVVISGHLTDAKTNETLIGAVVSCGNEWTITNSYGFYSLSVRKKDTLNIVASIVAYKNSYIKITEFNKVVNIKLNKYNTDIDEVIIEATNDNVVENNETGVLNIPIKEIKTLPNLFGEVDIIKAFQLMPGVQSGGEAKSGLYVRGGSSDQNLILLDEIPLYYVNHFGGMFSIFNADAVKSVKLIKGGFPARYGSRLSSILDVRLKDGNMQEYKVNGTLGILSSKIQFEGPIIKNKSSFIISVRKRVFPIFSIVTSGSVGYDFYDTNLKLNNKISDKNRLYFSFYTGKDIVSFKSKAEDSEQTIKTKKASKWGNTLAAIRFNHVFNSKLFTNITSSYTKYNYLNEVKYIKETDTTKLNEQNQVSSGIEDINNKLDFEYFALSNLSFKFGLNSIYHIFSPNKSIFTRESNYTSNIDTTFNKYKINAFENAAFIESDFRYKKISANLGIRLSNYIINDKTYYSYEPRLLFNLFLSKKISVKYSYSKMNQYVHLLNYSGVGLPSDFWMPTTENVAPEVSTQHSVNASFLFYKNILEFSFEIYKKEMKELIAFSPGESFFNNKKEWSNLIEKNGTGISSGIELLLQKHKGRLTGWIGATFSKSIRQFSNLNNGKEFPFKYDSPIDIGIVLQYAITKNINISATWAYHTGYPITLATERYFIEDREVFVYNGINSYRMNSFHRLDIGINFKKKKKLHDRTWTVSIINLYNRRNPYFYFYDRKFDMITGSGDGNVTIKREISPLELNQMSFFPFLPSFSYSFSF